VGKAALISLTALLALSGCSQESQEETYNRERCAYIDYLLESTNENIAGLVAQGYSAEASIRLKRNLEAERFERFCNKYPSQE
jgi:hypothetical protein